MGSVPYPPKFKPPTLHSYDGKSSPNQHIYYFQSQIGNVVGNDAIMARLFIGTLKGCLLYTSDAADDLLCVDLGGRRIIKKKRDWTHWRTTEPEYILRSTLYTHFLNLDTEK